MVDWEHPAHNDFLRVGRRFNVTGALCTRRTELASFGNGLLPLVIDLKKLGVPARPAFDETRHLHAAVRVRCCQP